MNIALGIDTGGTYTDAALIDQESGKVARRRQITHHALRPLPGHYRCDGGSPQSRFAVFSVALSKDPVANAQMDIAERLRYTSAFLTMALLFMLPFGLAFVPNTLPDTSDILWLLLAGGLFTNLTYYLYYSALTWISSLLAVVLISFTVLFTVMLEQLFLGISVLTVSFVAGAVLILTGVFFTRPGLVTTSKAKGNKP